MDHAGFLSAIRRAPDDPAPRLIYADWLDEAGDPRAGLIRAEERMRELAPFADEYWHLKPERDRLKADAPAAWLHDLGYDLPQPAFGHGWPDDVKGRWRVLRAFASDWYQVALPDAGGVAKNRLRGFGRRTPPALQELAAFAESMNDFQREWSNTRVDPHIVSEGQVVALFASTHRAGAIPLTRLDDPDPPIHIYRPTPGTEVPGGRPGEPALLTDYIRHALWNGPLGDASRLEVWIGADAPLELIRRAAGGHRGYLIYWDDVAAVWARPGGSVARVRVKAARGIRREALPEWVWPLCRRDGTFTGVFDDERRARG